MSQAVPAITRRRVISRSPDETAALGRQLAETLSSGDVIALYGPLGSGKTCFAQGVGRGLGVTEPITSPTFTLIQEYPGRMPLYHLDLYRLETHRELRELGLEEYFYGAGVCLVEWADHGAAFLPDRRWDVHLDLVAENHQWRSVTIRRR